MAQRSTSSASERVFLTEAQTQDTLRRITSRYTGIDADDLLLCMTLGRMALSLLTSFDRHFARVGVSQGRLVVMLHLSAEPTGLSPSALATRCGVSRAAITKLLDGLEQQGYAQRHAQPADGRSRRTCLTPAGVQFLDQILPADQQHLRGILQQLTAEERTQLLHLANKVSRIFREAADEESDTPDTKSA